MRRDAVVTLLYNVPEKARDSDALGHIKVKEAVLKMPGNPC